MGGQGVTGQAAVPDESGAGVAVHGFWKWGSSTLFDMLIVNLDAVSYLRQTFVKAPETTEKDKGDKYIHPCLECSCTFTPMV